MASKVTTSIRIDEDLLQDLKQQAKAENRSLSNYLETLLSKCRYLVEENKEYSMEELDSLIAEARVDYEKGNTTPITPDEIFSKL